MLTGELPFPSQFRKQNIPLTPPKQHNNKISDRVNAVIIKGMELSPQNRPQSVQEWLDLVMPKQVDNLVMPKEITNLVIPKQVANQVELVMPKQETNEVKLVSAVGMNYIKLRDLLAAGKWKEADEETKRVMLKVGRREKSGWLNTMSIDDFPCEDLRTIDQLWVKYSNGRFGFSVQKRIYQSLGGIRKHDEKIWEAYSDRVGWRVNSNWLDYDELKFNSKAPEGHLPHINIGWWGGGVGLMVSVAGALFERVETCKL
jgi:hypothetical protein